MGDFIKILIVLLCINIVLRLGGFAVIEGDILTDFIEIGDNNELKGLNSSFVSTIPVQPQVAGIDTSTSDFRIVDALKTVFSIFLFLLNIILAPLAIFTAPQLSLPIAFQYMIGVPILMAWIFVIIAWWRGND